MSDRDTVDQPSVNFVNVPYYKETGRVVCVSDNEQVDAGGEGFGLTPATLELDSAMGVGSRIIPSIESHDESERRVMYRPDRELVNTSREEFGSAPAAPESDSAIGVWSRTILSKETEDESEKVYRQLKELVDEPVAAEDKGERSKPKPKVGMRSGMKKGSKSWKRDSRVYSYDELIEYRPKRYDSDEDNC